jgi:hypothetical protein
VRAPCLTGREPSNQAPGLSAMTLLIVDSHWQFRVGIELLWDH